MPLRTWFHWRSAETILSRSVVERARRRVYEHALAEGFEGAKSSRINIEPFRILLAAWTVLVLLFLFVPIILVFVPLLMPTVNALGINEVQFGVITVFTLLIGLVTPPYGLTMFLLCRISSISMLQFWKEMWPIFGTMLVTLALITIFPELTTWLPDLLMPVK